MLDSAHSIDLDGRTHRVFVAGAGSPVVVFEPAIGDVALTWNLVHPEVARNATAFAHDPAGFGDSEPSPEPRTAPVMAGELRRALAAAGLAPPFLLVGHSFASLTVQVFAHDHPDEVTGMVLVDGAHEDQMERFPRELDPAGRLGGMVSQLRLWAAAARRGETVPEVAPVPTAFSGEVRVAYGQGVAPTATRLDATANGYAALGESQDAVRTRSGTGLGAMPLVVLRHGVPQPMPGVPPEVNEEYEATWRSLQAELAARSTRGVVRVATGAGHMIHHDRPDLVVAAITDVAAERSTPATA
jgi:pimeloyl-ACP methyl ester carboxylesterase